MPFTIASFLGAFVWLLLETKCDRDAGLMQQTGLFPPLSPAREGDNYFCTAEFLSPAVKQNADYHDVIQ